MDESASGSVNSQKKGSRRGSSDEKPSIASSVSSQPPPREPEVQSESPLDQSPPEGPPLDLGSIVTESLSILKDYRNFLSERKTNLAMASYYLLKLASSLQDYYIFKNKLDKFFAQHDVVASEIYCQHYKRLPVYGDYGKVLEDSPNPVKLQNISVSVPEAEIKTIVKSVVDNIFAGGNYTRTMHKVCKNINFMMIGRRGTIEEVMANFLDWYDLLDRQSSKNDSNAEEMFEIMSFINFLNSGIDEEPLQMTMPQ